MSLNDPNWGRGSRGPEGSRGGPGGGNQGPPDLDELWRNFNRRLSELFGRRRRGGDEPPRSPSSWQIGGGATLLVVLIALVWLASGFYIVVEGQRGIVLTFGRFSQETSPGLRWRPSSCGLSCLPGEPGPATKRSLAPSTVAGPGRGRQRGSR